MKMRYSGEPKSNYFRVSHWATSRDDFKDLKPTSQILYFTLCRLRNRFSRNGPTFIRSDRYLSQDSGLSRSAVGRAKGELKEKGFIEFTKYKRGNRCKYHLRENEDQVLTFGDDKVEEWDWEDYEEKLYN